MKEGKIGSTMAGKRLNCGRRRQKSSRTSKHRLHVSTVEPPEVFLHSGLRGLFLVAVLSEGGERGGDGISDKLIINLSKSSKHPLFYMEAAGCSQLSEKFRRPSLALD